MRLDKFLWCIRLFKTRTIASEHCDKEHILVNDMVAKSSRIISVGNVIAVKNPPIWKIYSVIGLPKSRIATKLISEFIIEKTPKEEIEKLQIVHKMNNLHHSLNIKGRPTKKERRNLDGFIEQQ